MRTIKALIVGVTIAITTVPMTGCAITQVFQEQEQTPQRIWFNAQEAFIVLVRTATQAKIDGRISQSDWDTRWNPAIQQGNALLDEMQAAYLNDDYESFNIAKAALAVASAILEGSE